MKRDLDLVRYILIPAEKPEGSLKLSDIEYSDCSYEAEQ